MTAAFHQTLPLGVALQQAVAHHQEGRLQDAELLYRAILQAQPNHPDANHNLGMLALQVKQPAAALPHFKAALEVNPNQRQYWLSYIDALIQAGETKAARQILEQARQREWRGDALEVLETRLEEISGGEPGDQEKNALAALFAGGQYTDAAILARKLTERFPMHRFGWMVLGATFAQMGRIEDALTTMQKLLALSPNDVEVLSNLGVILMELGRLNESETNYRLALQSKPDFAEAHANLGITLNKMGRLDEAEASYRRALEIRPDYAEAHNNLGITLQDLGRRSEAETAYRRALQIKPDYAEAHTNLGVTLNDLGRLDEAETSYRRALQVKPDFADAYINLGNTLKEMGQLGKAAASYQRALEINPDFIEAYSNLLFIHNYLPDLSASIILEEARKYGRMIAGKVQSHFANWKCSLYPDQLRIGIVSGDLYSHPVGYFLESMLAHLDPAKTFLIAYPTHHKADDLTARIKPHFAAWKPLCGMSDEVAARLIHTDAVHVLVDIAGHSANNRLPIFAWKPAPVQVSWLGYFATTGVATMDYLVADPWTLPETEEAYFTEKIWRLPETRLCFTPPDVDVEVSTLPALSNGYITFGCFNNLTKMNDDVVALWARVLGAVHGSRLFLKAGQLEETSMRQSIIERFAVCGIGADRLILEGFESREKYLIAYQRVDIALDPFPYPGGTTSVEGLWMGVPVLTLAGERFLSRQGVGILMNIGLPEWIAASAEDYVVRAIRHAYDRQRLSELRDGLRQQVLASPLFDAPRFARYFEYALRGMWQAWCNGQTKI